MYIFRLVAPKNPAISGVCGGRSSLTMRMMK